MYVAPATYAYGVDRYWTASSPQLINSNILQVPVTQRSNPPVPAPPTLLAGTQGPPANKRAGQTDRQTDLSGCFDAHGAASLPSITAKCCCVGKDASFVVIVHRSAQQ